MKKLMLSTVAAGAVFAAAPAMAQIDVTIGGHTKNYIGYMDQDTTTGLEARNFDMIRESELHFNAEGTADNGLTYGFHIETEVDGADSSTVEESYLYLASNLGRVNLGSEDGANYLLQVAAPSADANIDGIRQYINPVNYAVTGLGAAFGASLDYANDVSTTDEKITYLSPVWNGFQLGLSYTPDVAQGANEDINSASGLLGFAADDAEDNLSSAYEGAARYEGTYNNIGFAIGAGYTHVGIEEDTNDSHDDVQQWNTGIDLDIGAFGVGAIYTETNNVAGVEDVDSESYVVGVDYTTGPFQFGASYLNKDDDSFTAETDRYTGGVVYTAAPGLSFRGSISHVQTDRTGADVDATSVLGGVQMNF